MSITVFLIPIASAKTIMEKTRVTMNKSLNPCLRNIAVVSAETTAMWDDGKPPFSKKLYFLFLILSMVNLITCARSHTVISRINNFIILSCMPDKIYKAFSFSLNYVLQRQSVQ